MTNKIENGKRECVKETTIRPKGRKQPEATNMPSIQRENPAPGRLLHLATKQKCVLFSMAFIITELVYICLGAS